jgi:hypothetical protein
MNGIANDILFLLTRAQKLFVDSGVLSVNEYSCLANMVGETNSRVLQYYVMLAFSKVNKNIVTKMVTPDTEVSKYLVLSENHHNKNSFILSDKRVEPGTQLPSITFYSSAA